MSAFRDSYSNLAVQVIAIAEDCWKQNPVERPTMCEVCERLDAVLDSLKGAARQRREAQRG